MLGNLVPINETMDRNKYLHFLNDNALCHKAKSIKQFLNEIGVRTLNWAPQSPEKSMLENIWAYAKRKLSIDLARKRENTISDVKELWKDIFLEYILKLVDYLLKAWFFNNISFLLLLFIFVIFSCKIFIYIYKIYNNIFMPY